MKQILTHDTTFHADEVFAVAMLHLVFSEFGVSVTRTRDPEKLHKALLDPDVMVLDVGGRYDPAMNNYDHHQDMELPSAAGLVWRHWKNVLCEPEAQPFFQEFIDSIDAVDTNRNNFYATWKHLPLGFRNTSSLIAGFNRDPKEPATQDYMFEKAVNFAISILMNEMVSAVGKAKAEVEYRKRDILPNNVAVFREYSPVWKDKEEHVFAVMPHANGWQIQSRDTEIAVIPSDIADIPGFIFRHKSGFMATVKEFGEAVEYAKQLPLIV